MTLNVLDVSGYQKGIPTSVLNQSDEILIVKVTEGTALSNSDWKRQADYAISQGMLVGLYHFPRFGDSMAQAEAFLAQTQGYWGKGVAIPILDWEEARYTTGILAYPEFALDWLATVAKKTGATPWIYSGAKDAKNADSRLKAYPLWVAAYPSGAAQSGFGAQASWEWARDTIGGGLPGWTVLGWQYTGTGRLDGYSGDLDMSLFYATRAELDQYTGQAPQTTAVSSVAMVYPVPEDTRISQEFGAKATRYNKATGGHTGRDYAVPVGTTVKAMANGTVVWADWASNLPGDDTTAGWESRWLVHKQFAGITVIIDHGEFLSLYAHLSRTDLNVGDKVRAGEKIAESGNTGSATTGPHLHWEVIPKPYIWWTNNFFGRVHPAEFLEAHRTSMSAAASVISTLMEEIMALYANKEEFEQALERIIGKKLTKIHDELTPGKAGVKNAGSIFLLLYNLQGLLESFKNLFLPGKEKVRFEGDIRGILRKIADKAGK